MNRWMAVYDLLMIWPEGVALMFNMFFNDDALPPATARAVRHSVYRYLLLGYILLLRDMSISVKKQFPTYKHLIQAKLLTEKTQKRQQKNIMTHVHYGTFINEITRVRITMGDILCYDWIPIPLANIQTITFAVYFYLIIDGILQHYPLCTYDELNVVALTGRFAFSLLLNTFYLGWLKCSQVILNPFGLDDDDFQANSLIDMYQRNLAAILTRPEKPLAARSDLRHALPHTVGSALISGISETSLVGSMAGKVIPPSGQEIVKTPVHME
ncbi:hypothetical protein ANCCEY_06893 [Ancylostoma ceylanicum]|uniref:Bestrophin homolog n=1 Tax=Ancylostoma ceylanicum TaxID=53326 RepID=A0A0D6M284_9BILA|nr:hypothetical protein ANCCEY_06893 [Ancylostoma ceylanicum]